MSMFFRYLFIVVISLCTHQSCMPMQLSRVRAPKTKPQKIKAPKAVQPTYSTRLKSLANWFRGYSTSAKESAPKVPKTSSSFESKAYTTTAQPTGSWYGWFTNLFKQPATIKIPKEVYVKPPTIEQQFIAEPTERPAVETNQEPIAEEQPEQGFADTMQEFILGKDYRIKDYDTNDKDRRSRIYSITHNEERAFNKNDRDDVLKLFKHMGKDKNAFNESLKATAFRIIAESGIGKDDKRFTLLYKDVIDPQSSSKDFYYDMQPVIMGIIEKRSSYKNDLNANEYALNLYKKLNPQEKIARFGTIRPYAGDNDTFKDLYRLLTVTKPENYAEIRDNLQAVKTIFEYDKKSLDALDFAYKLLDSTIGQYVGLLTKGRVDSYANESIRSWLEYIIDLAIKNNDLREFIDLINKTFSSQEYKEQSKKAYYSGTPFGDAYKLLGLEPNVPFATVKAKTKALQKQYHPDFVRGKYNELISKEPDPEKKQMLEAERDVKEKEANDMLQKINKAFHIIEQSQPSNL